MKTNHIWTSLILFIFFESYSCYEWPSSIKRCSLNDTNEDFQKCLMDSTRKTIHQMARGVKAWGIPSMDPFKLPADMTLTNSRPPLVLTFKIMNATCDGPTDFVLHNASYDRKDQIFHFEGNHKRITLKGNYELIGTLFTLRLNSRGIFTFETDDVEDEFSAKLNPSKKRGHVEPKLGYKVKSIGKMKVWLKDAKLPPFIEDAVIDLVNNNWRLVSKIMLPGVEKGFEIQYNHMLAPLFRRFPLSEILLGSDVTNKGTNVTKTNVTQETQKKDPSPNLDLGNKTSNISVQEQVHSHQQPLNASEVDNPYASQISSNNVTESANVTFENIGSVDQSNGVNKTALEHEPSNPQLEIETHPSNSSAQEAEHLNSQQQSLNASEVGNSYTSEISDNNVTESADDTFGNLKSVGGNTEVTKADLTQESSKQDPSPNPELETVTSLTNSSDEGKAEHVPSQEQSLNVSEVDNSYTSQTSGNNETESVNATLVNTVLEPAY